MSEGSAAGRPTVAVLALVARGTLVGPSVLPSVTVGLTGVSSRPGITLFGSALGLTALTKGFVGLASLAAAFPQSHAFLASRRSRAFLASRRSRAFLASRKSRDLFAYLLGLALSEGAAAAVATTLLLLGVKGRSLLTPTTFNPSAEAKFGGFFRFFCSLRLYSLRLNSLRLNSYLLLRVRLGLLDGFHNRRLEDRRLEVSGEHRRSGRYFCLELEVLRTVKIQLCFAEG